jgi:catechol 2,3-dioxygenase-like lactoylglutathione lyase family enzyme
MNLRHIGQVCRSEETADRFYGRLLRLKKSKKKSLPAAISSTLFGINSDLGVLNYMGGNLHFEIFICGGDEPAVKPPAHICLEVRDLDRFLERCRAADIAIIRLPKGDQWITFIRDYDGNLFEIKEAKI